MKPASSQRVNGKPRATPAVKTPALHRPATLADVAKRAGVVAMTASRAINKSGYVSDEVRKRVLAAARHLKYRPNMMARRLKGQQLNAIGMMLADIANPFSTALVQGAKQVFDKAGYTAFLAVAGEGIEQEQSALQSLVDHRVDGLLIASRGTTAGDKMLRELAKQSVPIVTIGRPVNGVAVDCVTADHWQGAFDAVTHIIAMGHTRIGFIGISAKDAHTLRRYQGYEAALQKAGITVRAEYTTGPAIAPVYATQEDGFAGMIHLAKLKQPPTAVFARNDFAAMGAMRAAYTLGLKIPQEMAICGFDNIPLSGYATPPLTTVSQPIVEQGRLAAQMLIDRIEHRLKGAPRLECMDCKLIARESTDPSAATSS